MASKEGGDAEGNRRQNYDRTQTTRENDDNNNNDRMTPPLPIRSGGSLFLPFFRGCFSKAKKEKRKRKHTRKTRPEKNTHTQKEAAHV